MDLREIGCGGMGWIDLAQDRDQWTALVNMVMNLTQWDMIKPMLLVEWHLHTKH
jgi:hypothetical protein